MLTRSRKIGNGAMIGTGSDITEDISDFTVFAGNTARYIKYRFDGPLEKSIPLKPFWNEAIQKLIDSDFLFAEEAGRESWSCDTKTYNFSDERFK